MVNSSDKRERSFSKSFIAYSCLGIVIVASGCAYLIIQHNIDTETERARSYALQYARADCNRSKRPKEECDSLKVDIEQPGYKPGIRIINVRSSNQNGFSAGMQISFIDGQPVIDGYTRNQ